MPEYLAPGVYVEEIDTAPPPIEGVSTSTVGAVGMTVRGPVDGLPRLVTSFNEFRRVFGGYLPEAIGSSRFLAHAVQGFFENGGQRIYVKRVPGANNATASTLDANNVNSLVGGVMTFLKKDVLAGATSANLGTLRGIVPGTQLTFTQVKNGITTTESVTVTGTTGTDVVNFTGTALQNSYEARYTGVATNLNNPGTPVVIKAADPGLWGNSLSVRTSHISQARAEFVGLVESTPASGVFDTVVLSTGAGFYPGAIVEANQGNTKQNLKVQSVSGTSIVVAPTFTASTDLDPDQGFPKTLISTCEFRIVASYLDPATNEETTEEFAPLTLDNITPYYYARQINDRSGLIATNDVPDNGGDPLRFPNAQDGRRTGLAGGADGAVPDANAFIGVDNGPGQRSGIRALEDIDQVSIVIVPLYPDPAIQNMDMTNFLAIQGFMITHCELLKDRFAILDPVPHTSNGLQAITDQRSNFDTRYAALYYPRVFVLDPVTRKEVLIPPSGHMAGIYARTDIQRGVHKAPANEVVRGITRLEVKITKGEQDILNVPPNQINVIRDFRAQGRGIRVWGARCITSESLWKYVPVRRLFIFLEESLDEGTQWVVFEPNAPPLWARVRQSISNFLDTVWRNGALFGDTAEQAYFVICDETTMTQDDLDNGRLIILVGVAPVKPAEYVIIRISQKTALQESEAV